MASDGIIMIPIVWWAKDRLFGCLSVLGPSIVGLEKSRNEGLHSGARERRMGLRDFGATEGAPKSA